MTLDELKELIKKENRQLEFKSSTSEIHKACRTVCAFLNNHGGVVLIGVKNDGRIVGQMVTDPTCQEIANDIRKIEPPVVVDVSYIPIGDGKVVIAIDVPAGEHMPYVFDGRPYHRVESETVPMPQHLYEQLLVKRGQQNHTWEENLAYDYGVEDLDHDEIRKLVRHGIEAGRIPDEATNHSIDEILDGLELIEEGQLINAAVVLFAKKVTPRYPQCMIKMARFRGDSETSDFIDNQQFSGNAFKIIEQANIFMKRHFSIASFYQPDSFVRIDKPTLPVLAVREAMINSICHKEYTQRSSAITLAIFNNRMELWNVGTLPKQLPIEALERKHRSYPRNKLIANAFYMKGYIETWGTGTTKMFEQCREHGIPDPIFEEYSGGVSVQFMFAEPIGPHVGERIGKPKEEKIDLDAKFENLTRRQREIINVIRGLGEAKSSEILEKMSESIPESTLRRDLGILKKHDILISKGVTVNTVWTLKK